MSRGTKLVAMPPGLEAEGAPTVSERAIEVERVRRRFGTQYALRDLTLAVAPREVHAVLGPNGAGKTTLLRILAGTVEPDAGQVRILGAARGSPPSRRARQLIGLVPSGDRSFYLRISGWENLVFFGRMYGMRRREAQKRARACLQAVGLADATRQRVGTYSHGMQRRLAVARALLTDPVVLLVDEATHDLDPGASRRVRDLVTEAAARGAAVIWATQRLDEIRGFADRVTVLHRGETRFSGTVAQLLARSPTGGYLLQLRNGMEDPVALGLRAQTALGTRATIAVAGLNGEHCSLWLRDRVTLGEALASLHAAGIEVLACREERSELEAAFLAVTGDGEP